MRSLTLSVRLPYALLECLPSRIALLGGEMGNLTRNGYITALVRGDLSFPAKPDFVGFDMACRPMWYQDRFDDKLLEHWRTQEPIRFPAIPRKEAA